MQSSADDLSSARGLRRLFGFIQHNSLEPEYYVLGRERDVTNFFGISRIDSPKLAEALVDDVWIPIVSLQVSLIPGASSWT